MNTILAITILTYKEALRYRVLYGTFIISLTLMFFSILLSGLFLRENSKIILDLCLSSVSVGGLLIPFFLAINLIAKDIENKTLISILSRPVSRSQYILGKFGGILLLTATIMTILCIATILSTYLGEFIYGEYYFINFSAIAVILAIIMNFLGITILNSLVVLWCCLTTSPFLATLLTIFSYLIGHTIDDIVRFLTTTAAADITTPIRVTVKFTHYIFPNLAAFDFKQLAAHGINTSLSEISLLACYAISYITAVLALAIFCFSRRDLH